MMPRSGLVILAKASQLVHALMQDRDDADRAIRQLSPIDIMSLVTAIKAIDPEFGRDRARDDVVACDPLETAEQPVDIGVGLILSPGISGINEYLVEPLAGGWGNPECQHGQGRLLRAITLWASSAA
ncbi:hypothetical protein DFR49_1279 [Hephaestia caeni]|uniref:Uncharacterized protein n=1 Tax=Hephaestia caeni TaxID=645617 RepID=A0A397PAX2_9SPHN|nr:hypothetical protein DFR49_1279 [Hephaestia caeni]